MPDGKFFEGALLGRSPDLHFEGGVAEVRQRLGEVMEGIRDASDSDASMPKKPFARKLTLDIDDAVQDVLGDDRYEVRYYSAVDTPLDHLGGVDFWVELYDTEDDMAISTYKVDLTMNSDKAIPSNMADAVFYVEDSEDEDPEQGRRKIYGSRAYANLVERAADNLVRRAKMIRRAS